jgi:hypothetical protein
MEAQLLANQPRRRLVRAVVAWEMHGESSLAVSSKSPLISSAQFLSKEVLSCFTGP